MTPLTTSRVVTPDGDTSCATSSDCAGGGVGGEGGLLEAVAPDCLLGEMLGLDEPSLAGRQGCDSASCVLPRGAREGDWDELSFERRLPNFFLMARIMRVEYVTSWMVEESGKEHK